jgi:uncharacterized membrane protein YfcA
VINWCKTLIEWPFCFLFIFIGGYILFVLSMRPLYKFVLVFLLLCVLYMLYKAVIKWVFKSKR